MAPVELTHFTIYTGDFFISNKWVNKYYRQCSDTRSLGKFWCGPDPTRGLQFVHP
jgi:hypothetical protein